MVEAAGRGELKAMYIVGENPFLDEANLDHARHAMHNLEFLVVQDIFMQETAADRATSSCRRPRSPRRKAPSPTPSGACSACARRCAPVGKTRPDWAITAEIARRVARRLGPGRSAVRLRLARRDLGRDGRPDADHRRHQPRPTRPRGRASSGPARRPDHPGHAQPVHRELSAAERPGASDAGPPGAGGHGAARRRSTRSC